MSIPDLLDEVADEVSRDGGWIQKNLGAYESESGPVCAMGGIYRILRRYGVNPSDCQAQNTLSLPVANYVRDHPKEYGDEHTRFADIVRVWPLISYNNTPGRTAGEVADLFRTVAKHLREEE